MIIIKERKNDNDEDEDLEQLGEELEEGFGEFEEWGEEEEEE